MMHLSKDVQKVGESCVRETYWWKVSTAGQVTIAHRVRQEQLAVEAHVKYKACDLLP
jgi:hypothetical protein